MIKQLENQIRDLQKELAEIRKSQAALRLQPCLGDSEIRVKEEKFEDLDRRAAVLVETIRDLTRKHQLLLSEAAPRTIYKFLV
jgi:predicted  nucleic acid-binding Zn-ribbon protein